MLTPAAASGICINGVREMADSEARGGGKGSSMVLIVNGVAWLDVELMAYL